MECAVAVAEHLNFSKAARQLNMSQPPLTRHIQVLEEKLGTKLFERDTHSVSITDHGKLFLEDARAILNHLDRASESIRRAKEGEISRLRIGFVGALLDEELVGLIRNFREQYPTCQVRVADLAPSKQIQAIAAGELDGGFIGAKPTRSPKEMALYVWRREPLLLALPEDHPLTLIRSLKWRDLKNLPWVMVTNEAGPAFRQQFSELARRYKLEPRIVHETERIPAILTMVAAGGGVSMVPKTVTHLLSNGVAFREIPKPHPVLQNTFAYRTPGASPAMTNFLSLLLKSAVRQGEHADS